MEPLESTAIQAYTQVARDVFNHYIPGKSNVQSLSNHILSYIRQLQTFILWHYQFGSKYDTPFWEYAKSIPFETYGHFDKYLGYSKISDCMPDLDRYGGRTQNKNYGQWPPASFKNWNEGMNNKYLKTEQ